MEPLAHIQFNLRKMIDKYVLDLTKFRQLGNQFVNMAEGLEMERREFGREIS